LNNAVLNLRNINDFDFSLGPVMVLLSIQIYVLEAVVPSASLVAHVIVELCGKGFQIFDVGKC
jgi:hypothetical protein